MLHYNDGTFVMKISVPVRPTPTLKIRPRQNLPVDRLQQNLSCVAYFISRPDVPRKRLDRFSEIDPEAL